MKSNSILALTVALSAATVAGCAGAEVKPQPHGHFAETVHAQTFFKGNIHTHTNRSDGDASPETVISWYKKHGYQFLAITDHDSLTVNHSLDNHDFITINGDEVTGEADGVAAGALPVHVNALCGSTALKGIKEKKPTGVLLNELVQISHRDGAVTLVNHPNYKWAIDLDQLKTADGFELLEIATGNPLVKDKGDDSHPAEEELWDGYMVGKHRVFGAAVDDAHNYSKFDDKQMNPGRAWVAVWAPELKEKAICEALRNGHFYSSRGSKITALVVEPQSLELSVENWQPSTDHVDFIGAGGRLLDRTMSLPARYELRGFEGYVRAHVVQASGHEAWTQAYFLKHE